MDYYAILRIAPAASPEEVRQAYRALAKQHHPDRNPQDAEAADRFKRVAAAYSVLSDPEERARYDAARRRQGAPGAPSVTIRPGQARRGPGEAVEFPCPNPACGQRLQVARRHLGARLRCPLCGHRFRTGAHGDEAAGTQALDADGTPVVVGPEWIDIGGERLRAAEVRGIRYGAVRDRSLGHRTREVWLTDGSRERRVAVRSERAFGALVDALLAAVRVPILARMVLALESGEGFEVGEVFLDGYGLHRFGEGAGLRGGLSRWMGSLFGDLPGLGASHLPWEEVGSVRLGADRLTICDRFGRPWATLSLRGDWNAVLLPALFRALSRA